jgi:hypothetical protein
MKKLLMLITMVLLTSNVIAQDDLYLIFEFMKVDNEQETAYMETESFWEKIHEQRVKNGDIIGWDLWRLNPGGEDQGFQYMTVNLYKDALSMFDGDGGFDAALKAAYPNMSEDELNKKFNATSKSRDLAVRIFLEQINTTKDEFDMPLGTIAAINLMKVALGDFAKYEKAESEVFKPFHQKEVDEGRRANWGLLRYMSPVGSTTFASHITVDMYKDYNQFFMENNNDDPEPTEAQQKAIQDGLDSRDLKYRYMATLIKKVR